MDAQDTQLAYYESIGQVSKRMLKAARENDWDALIEAERSCAELIHRLQAASEPQAALDPSRARRKHEIIRSVLADDAQIRNLTQPWLLQLEQHLGVARLARRVGAAYRS